MLSFAIPAAFSSLGSILLLAFGFGFVIFWHELGHFLAAKWADVKVEQFAVGFGQALFSWRKGLGFRWGSSQAEYQSKLRGQVERTTARPVPPASAALESAAAEEGAAGAGTFGDLPTDNAPRLTAPDDPTDAQLDQAGREVGVSETEYRLNWIPLGGYVKMLGQDDLRPGEQVVNPRSYTSKPVGQRMVIVSAGVIMNVILAGIGFMVLFKIGYDVPPATVGQVIPGAPAQLAVLASDPKVLAPIAAGDTVLKVDGRWMYEFNKIKLNTPLLIPGEPVTVDVRRAGTDRVDRLIVIPRKPPDNEFPLLGIAPAHALLGPDAEMAKLETKDDKNPNLQPAELGLFRRGDVITAVAGQPVATTGKPDGSYQDAYKLTDALQKADGKPVPVTVRGADGQVRTVELPPHFAARFGDQPVEFAGLQMLPQVFEVDAGSPLETTKDKAGVLPGDVVVDVADDAPSGGHRMDPTTDELKEFVHDAADKGSKLTVTVRRGGKDLTFPVQLDPKQHPTLGVGLTLWEAEPVVATPPKDTPASAAGVPGGARLTAVDGRPVHNWFDVFDAMRQVNAGRSVKLAATVGGQEKAFTVGPLSDAEVAAIGQNRIDTYAIDGVHGLQPAKTTRRADGLVQAGEWGVSETRDAIVQVYLTVRAMFRGSVSPKELSGPVGILAVGYKFAEDSYTRLLWFLSIISANLAVMNFLPIPVVDGGLFTFLVIEKLKGSPISQKTQYYAQAVGLALLLSVFLFATWQDVGRIGQLFH